MLRRLVAIVLGTAFGVSHFVALPVLAVDLNARWGWPRWSSPVSRAAGGLLVVVAAAIFVRCAVAFRTVGRGTPQPLMPPERLVTTGLYRYSRNPIYVA